MKKVKAGSVYFYNPVAMDVWDNRTTNLKKGDEVRVVNLPSAPKANTMGHCHVQRLNGEFVGMVLTASLTKEKPLSNQA